MAPSPTSSPPPRPLIPENFSKITINGEEYMPTPHELNPEIPEDMVWTSIPHNPDFLNDPDWYNAIGEDLITQRRIWGKLTDDEQIDAFRELLRDCPTRALDMMFEAAVKGKPHVVRFLLGEGVRGTMDESKGDNRTLAPLTAAAYQGNLECVKVLIEEGGLDVDTRDEIDGTPLMRACWGNKPEVTTYLLDMGADIDAREKHPAVTRYLLKDLEIPADVREKERREGGNEQGRTALNRAAMSGSIICAQLLFARASAMGRSTAAMITRSILADGAQSDDPEMVRFLLEKGGYPVRTSESDWKEDIDAAQISDDFKEVIEYAFQMALYTGKHKSVSYLYSYMELMIRHSEYRLTRSKNELLDALIFALISIAEHDDQEHINTFNFLYDVSFGENAAFSTPMLQDKKSSTLSDALYWAANNGNLNMIKAIAAKSLELDVNQLSKRVAPYGCTSLYTAAGTGHNHVVEYLFDKFGDKLDVHKAVGKFANGPTALWITVRNGFPNTVKMLLARGGGPVEYIDELAKPSKLSEQSKKIVITATTTLRSPVKLLALETLQRETGKADVGQYEKGGDVDQDGNEFNFVIIDVDAADLDWWDKLQYRNSDEDLLGKDSEGRELKPKPDPAEVKVEERPEKKPKLA